MFIFGLNIWLINVLQTMYKGKNALKMQPRIPPMKETYVRNWLKYKKKVFSEKKLNCFCDDVICKERKTEQIPQENIFLTTICVR